ncbi:MAG: putative aspartate aminotransferase 2 [Methanomassiliicoccales archaeon PtaU1.Bin124]|nr:MAG: putative aspartate aminotransferase 2 [Methanomassiliicoccales archaeon PtaU1.Bin124]
MVARRMGNVPESGTVKISNVVSKLKLEGVNDIISFSMGEPDFPTPENITNACVDSLRNHFTYYTPSAGIPELRQAVAETLNKRNSIPCKDKDVLITPTKQAIFMTMLAMVEEGDEVIVPDPSWGTFDACARLAGAKVKYAKVSPDNDYRLTPESLAEAVTPKTKLMVINTPSNPCGAVMTRKDIEGAAKIAKEANSYVMADEIYEQLVFDGEHVSISSLPGMFERTITLGGFSKTYAMTGWRLGWAIAPAPIFKELNKLQMQSITCAVSFVQNAGVEALRGPQKAVADMKKEFKARRDLIYDLTMEIPQMHCPRPHGAFYLFPSYDIDMPSEDLAAYLLEKAHVALTPGSAFGPSGEGHLRISYAASRKDIIEGMERIKKALATL